ncbi:MAG TPA: flagellar basal body P-ring formation chaperone FlgA [Rhodopila sp.]|jgi:flagella basal body P-ring formation protein FlgA
MRILAFLLAVLVSAPAQAAALRSLTTLHGPTVYLRDLFDDAGTNANSALGPGPGPGARIIVGAAQLNAIAREYDVAWRSASRADHAVLEWPGRPLRKDEATDAVRTAIEAGNPADDMDIDLAGFTPPIVPLDIAIVPTVSQLDYDSGTGRFAAVLTITGAGMNPIESTISGVVEQMVQAPVASTRLLPQTVLRRDDVHIARVRAASVQNQIARSIDQIVGMQLRRPVPAGQPLLLTDLTQPPLVLRGSTVQIELSSAGLTITGQAIAMDAGADGDQIRVQNITSRAYLFAQVVGPGQVRVTPGAPPALSTAPPHFEARLAAQ